MKKIVAVQTAVMYSPGDGGALCAGGNHRSESFNVPMASRWLAAP
jgi:hypothetical protein